MKFLAGRWFHRAQKGSALSEDEKERCQAALRQFEADPRHRSLNFERLGSGPKQNHWSIRASRELRVILAVEPGFGSPERVMIANMGHHDEMYEWAKRRHFRSDLDDGADIGEFAPAEGQVEALWSSRSLQEWAIFLHPDQKRWVTRRFEGVARVRGGAGTGKTVLALHRAAALARRFPGEEVLYTTFIRSLLPYVKEMYESLPNAPTNVVFLSVFQVANRVLGEDFSVDRKKVYETFDIAYDRTISDTAMARYGKDYLRKEIEWVIKGRGTSKEEYLDTDRFQRLGRRLRFRRGDREVCWNLLEAWDEEMRKAGTGFFPDVAIRARDELETRDKGIYRAAIIDEGQDMTAVMMQLVRAAVAGKRTNPVPEDGLLVLDDSAQRLYPGGFLPIWAGLDVRGRSVSLEICYRTTRRIVEAAVAVRGKITPVRDDNDDGASGIRDFESGDGVFPVFLYRGKKEEIPTIGNEIRRLMEDEGFAPEEIGVFVGSNKDVGLCFESLSSGFNIPCEAVKSGNRARGGTGGKVRIATFDRSKGLEFRAVFIPRMGASIFPERHMHERKGSTEVPETVEDRDLPAEQEQEERQLVLDRLYVGMTRARERVYLVADESPCKELENAREFFDWYPPSRPYPPVN